MKKIFCFMIAIFTVFVIPFALFSQDSIPPPGDVITLPPLPITFEFGAYVKTFFLFAASVIFLTSLVNKFIKLKGFAKQYLSWFVALLVALAAFFLNLGIFEPIQFWQALIYAALAGFGANGIFDWAFIQKFLIAVHLEDPPAIAKR
ncbi:MAG: hypothetical protein PHT07_15405 [Paludibacter sp.]|nr:hypothetical protein [Paludibacter sp.]